MKITVCELRNTQPGLSEDWEDLIKHVESQCSDLVLLPEMPFHPWVASNSSMDPDVWRGLVEAHDRWISRLPELGCPVVTGTRPVIRTGKRLNEGFIWDVSSGYQPAHTKCYLPDEKGFWEATWYHRGERDFSVKPARQARVGFLICTELWFGAHAREYARQGVHLLVCPRATPLPSNDKWIAGGRTAAVVSGAFCLSSNLSGMAATAVEFGGHGWIIEPEAGRLLGLTSREQPFLTLDVDLKAAENAKHTYPRYVLG